MTEEQIGILKILNKGNSKKDEVMKETGRSWEDISKDMDYLKKEGYILLWNYGAWTIQFSGKNAIKKWDLDGTPGELFEEVKNE